MTIRPGLPPALDRFDRLHVLVLGEAMLDRYLDGPTHRLCPEAPVPVVALASRRDAPGGAANTALNARALGARVRLLSTVGNDAEGAALRATLEAHGISARDIQTCRGRRTLTKTRVCAAGQLLVRYDQGDTDPIDVTCEGRLIDRLVELFRECDAVVLSDYGYGLFTPRVIETLAELQAQSPRVAVGDSKRLDRFRPVGLTAVKPNFGQALKLLGEPPPAADGDRAAFVAERADRLLELTGARVAAVTLDRDGALVCERGRPPRRSYACPVPANRTAGAGDTYTAALALALAAGADTPAAAELAGAAAAVVVAEDVTAACTAGALRAHLTAGDKVIADRAALAARVEHHRRHGKRVVFTNGCFDILHRGHTTYLARAKALGDVLVVGVNTDASIHRLKGPDRPINALEDRVQVLAALNCVDLVAPFGEDTPHALIRVVRPDVFAKGGDYTRERLPEASLVEELGGEIRLLPVVEDRSTTHMIERIRAAAAGPDGRPTAPGKNRDVPAGDAFARRTLNGHPAR